MTAWENGIHALKNTAEELEPKFSLLLALFAVWVGATGPQVGLLLGDLPL